MTTYLCLPNQPAPLEATERRPGPRYESLPGWSTRKFESAETTRLNEAHWRDVDDQSVNVWLASQLTTIRSRAIYEARNNGIVQGVINTMADDIVGPDGPTLQVQSDNEAYDRALERLWRQWFKAPTPRPNVSGAALLKLWIRSLWKCGEFLAQITTDAAAAEPVKLRLRPIHPRRLATPAEYSGDADVCMGIRFDSQSRPATYYVANATVSGTATTATVDAQRIPPDLIIHEFVTDEEDQARGIPWLNPALPATADLRDYDAQIQDAARQMADQASLLYTDHPDAQLWENPESVEVERRTVRMVPPGWKPFTYPATQPPAQYPDYRAERFREIGRPVGMPLLMVRLDASRHNYSSARLDTQVYRRSIAGIQTWISGSDRTYGTLTRLVDEIAREARFAVPELRSPPAEVSYIWTWPVMPHVDPVKEATAEGTALANRTESITGALAARGRDLESHVATLAREATVFEAAGVAAPAYMSGGGSPAADDDQADDLDGDEIAAALDESTADED
jgi:lambda family phage portal protein